MKANNKYMGEKFDSSKPSSYIIYLDANKLCGWATSQELPTGGFKWMNDEELKNQKDIPCILEVDMEYPENCHDNRNDYPLVGLRASGELPVSYVLTGNLSVTYHQ